ncbi:MAG TPA: D-glycero-beta-D-manno-heptose 1-phosphate adenylyltransferase [Candidatus Latescibacteria bacterium]|nr:D-glycero-beta-D-manno-heptose 1-phosphate adenylyltransferase [Candidatus Latescibacterota bacterium]
MGKVVALEDLVEIRSRLKSEGKRVIFTNGCFDILHRGHVHYLKKAKARGDVLIVGLNSDSSVRRLKGEGRPIIPEEDRAAVLAGLEAVDYVCIFEEETPARLISKLVPDLLVKGSDWAPDQIVGRDTVTSAGGEVLTIDELPSISTSSIIERIVERYCKKTARREDMK